MKNKMLLGVLVFALAAALVGGATMAWFTDAGETETVDFQAGTLMIDLDNFQDNSATTVNLDRLNPGDCAEWQFNVNNAGTKSANWLLYMCWQELTGLENIDGIGQDQVELLEARDDYGTGYFSDVLEWTISAGNRQVEGTLAEIFDELELDFGMPLVLSNLDAFAEGQGTKTVTVRACLPESVGNQYQGATMDLAFGVKAWQTTNGATAPEVTKADCPFNGDPGPDVCCFKATVNDISWMDIGEGDTAQTQFDVEGIITARDGGSPVVDFEGEKEATVKLKIKLRIGQGQGSEHSAIWKTLEVTFVEGEAPFATTFEKDGHGWEPVNGNQVEVIEVKAMD